MSDSSLSCASALEKHCVSPSDVLAHARRRAERVHALRDELRRALPNLAGGRPVNLELCCGHGHFLVDYAAQHPSEVCVGVDFCRDRIQRATRKQERARLPNVRFWRAEAFEFLDAWPAGLLVCRTFVLFPDPWPKRRHRKNRLVGPTLYAALARLTGPGAQLYFRTDAPDYFGEARAALAIDSTWSVQPSAPWPFDRATVFQQKAAAFQSLCAINVAPAMQRARIAWRCRQPR